MEFYLVRIASFLCDLTQSSCSETSCMAMNIGVGDMVKRQGIKHHQQKG